MRILLASSEAVPFCKTGGLADVVGTLAKELGAGGHDVALFLPHYRGIELPELGALSHELSVPLGSETVLAALRHFQWKSVSVFTVDCPALFDREGLYGHDGKDHADNDRRFLFFSRAVLEGAKTIGFKPDVIHIHDWQTALIAGLLKRQYAEDPFFTKTRTLLTIHNIAYQGIFPASTMALAGFPKEDFSPERLDHHGQFSFLKGGIVFADGLTTVSPTYAREIRTSPEFGMGLEDAVEGRSSPMEGVLNGLDLDVWDPSRDRALARSYGVEDAAAGKGACKAALQKECGLDRAERVPLIGIVSRFDRQKGLDLAADSLERLAGRCQVVVLGTGDPTLTGAFRRLAEANPKAVHLHSGFDEPFAHQIYAAVDLFLMPSRFEPCGLGQMIAMRYGALPVATRTGGLADTVFEAEGGKIPANGFLAERGDRESLSAALERALSSYDSGGDSWRRRVRAAMEQDFSWDASVRRYVELYKRL